MTTFFLIYIILGAFTGIFAGLLGVGGGLVIVPMLMIVFPYQHIAPEIVMHMALGTSLASIIFISISSALAHNRHGGVDWCIVRNITLGIMIGTYGGSYIAALISAKYLQLGFACYLLYAAKNILFSKEIQAARELPAFFGLSIVGVVIGAVSSMVGIGGGSLSVPYMIYHNIDMRRAIGTSAAIGLPIAIAGAAGYAVNGFNVASLPPYSLGYIYLPALVGIVILSILTAPYGAKLAHTLPVAFIRKGFAILLLIIALRMMYQAI